MGTAKALDYLHGGAGNMQPVIHRDVKSSNILLSEDFEPQVSCSSMFQSHIEICMGDCSVLFCCLTILQLADFGLAKWASASASQLICNDVAGTFGLVMDEEFS